MDDLPYDHTDPMGFRRRAELAKRHGGQRGDSDAVAQRSEAAAEDVRKGRQDGKRASQSQTKRQMTTSIFAPPKQQQKKPQGRAPSSTAGASQPQRLPAAEKKDGDRLSALRARYRAMTSDQRADHYFALRDIRREVEEAAREKAARKEMEKEDANLKRSRPGFW
ncbi:hypothetical protein DL769_005160 [Monosporascus sp. CRB-8-3]|nr:hypothetical protein DL769_005160 [Monosporascus sp. CRB-8-3]